MSTIDKNSNIQNHALSATEVILDMLSSWEKETLPVSALCKGGELLGFREQNIRVALNRLISQGKVSKRIRGQYGLERSGNTLLTDIESWQEKPAKLIAWEGNWIGVLDHNVARSQRKFWRKHIKALELRGFQQLATGLHIRPDNLRGGAAGIARELNTLGLDEQSIVIGISHLEPDYHEQAKTLWDIKTLEGNYQRHIEQLLESSAKLDQLKPEEAAAESLILGRYAIRTIVRDPLLPKSFMQSDLREKLIELTGEYQIKAREVWRHIPEFF